jgi:MHS family citrate/tricarballylate:H+ symporter-like MFS transporter
VVAILLGGWISDRIGRRPVMIWPNVVFLAIVYPLFVWIVDADSVGVLLAGAAIFGFMRALGFGAFFAALTESLPKPIRGSGLAIVYATAIAIFGGTAQNVVAWLIHVTGDPLAITWYVILSGVIAVIAIMFMLETAPVRRSAAAKAG